MSRVGKKLIQIPEGVNISCDNNMLTIEGPKGKLMQEIHPLMNIEIDKEKGQVLVRRTSDEKQFKAFHGLTRTLLSNNVRGVTDGFSKELEIIGLGYNVKLQGNDLVLQLGFSHPVILKIPQGIRVEIKSQANPGRLIIMGIDKQLVGQFAADIRSLRPPEPYKGKGIKYVGEIVRRKAGKAVASTA